MHTGHGDFIPATLEDLACYWFVIYAQHHKAPASLKRDQGILKNYILPSLGHHLLTSLTTRQLDSWFAGLLSCGRLGHKSCNDVLVLLKKILGDGERWGFLDKNPSKAIKKKSSTRKDYHFWRLDEIRQYVGFWTHRSDKARIFDVVFLALHTGMRRGELIALRWNDIDFNEGLIRVKDSYCRISKTNRGTTKSNKARTVPINTMLRHYLDELKERTGHSEWVLPRISPDLYCREFQRSCVHAGVPSIRFHDLRHTFATHFLMAGGSIYDLQKILGHASITTTEIYVHMVAEHLKGKTEVLPF